MKIELTGTTKTCATTSIRSGHHGLRDKQYNLLTNLSYATRAVSASLLKRRSADDLLSATLDYTFQVASRNRTAPTDEIFSTSSRGA
jgi:hypothetical protein